MKRSQQEEVLPEKRYSPEEERERKSEEKDIEKEIDREREVSSLKVQLKKVNLPLLPSQTGFLHEEELDLEDQIVQETNESQETYTLRWKYTLLLPQLPSPIKDIDNKGMIVLGFMFVKKLRYGITYDRDTEILLQIIDVLIQESLTGLLPSIESSEIKEDVEKTLEGIKKD